MPLTHLIIFPGLLSHHSVDLLYKAGREKLEIGHEHVKNVKKICIDLSMKISFSIRRNTRHKLTKTI